MSNEHTEDTTVVAPVAIPDIRYTRMLTCILYEGGAENVLEQLHHKGVNEAYYYNVRGNPIGRASLAGGYLKCQKLKCCTLLSPPTKPTTSTTFCITNSISTKKDKA